MVNLRIGHVVRVGNSVAVVIPAALAREMKFERGDEVIYGVFEEGEIRIRKVTPEMRAAFNFKNNTNE